MTLKERMMTGGFGRMGLWAYAAMLTSGVLMFLYPHQLGTVLFKINLVSIAAWVGYWIDRSAFPYARPGDLDGPARDAAALRRAIVIGSTMLAVGMAL